MLLVAGIWIVGLMTPNVYVHGAVAAVWALLVAVGVMALTRNVRGLRRSTWGAYVATLVVVLAVGTWMSRPREIDETVVTARPAKAATTAREDAEAPEGSSNVLVGEGRFVSLAHDTRGRAQVIELANGRKKLTLTGFKTDSGPDLFVIAVPGDPQGDADVQNIMRSAVRPAQGLQRREVGTIYIWCRAFTVGFGRAELQVGRVV